MAKKRIKNIKLEQEELKSTTIGVFENRKKSSIGIFFIMSIFVLAVVFLPQISEYIEAYLHPSTPPTVNPGTAPKDPNKPSVDDEPDYADTFYTLAEDLKIERNDITVDTIILNNEESTLSFKVTNNSNSALIIGDLNYFMELYNDNQTLLARIKLTGDTSVMNKYSQTLTKNINSNTLSSAKSIVLVKKNSSDYPAVDINTTEDGTGILVCTKEHEKVTYKFSNGSLKEVTSEISYLKTDEGYAETYENNKKLSNTYNGKTGVVSTFFEYPDVGYNITTNVNLKESGKLYIFNADSFLEDTEPKVVSFEMEAQGFSCK